MANLLSKIAIVTVALIAVLYQFVFKTIIFDTLGYGRSVSTISAFNVRCQKIDHLNLEGCEDMWLHEPTGFLYMACSNSQSRTQWLPALDFFNASGRGLTDGIVILDTRGPGALEERIKWVTVENFAGIKGDGTLNLHGFDVRADENTNNLRILLINHRPPIDPITGEPLDAASVGANSTIELFQTTAGSPTMRHVRTYFDETIQTPNNLAWVNDHAFVFTNDHSAKTGFRRQLDSLIGGGSVGYCSRNHCNIAHATGFNFPNGLVRGRDSLIYVPNTITAEIQVFSLNEHHTLDLVDSIKVPYPIDNLSVDKNGDIYAATFPQAYVWSKSSKDPFGFNPAAAVFRVRKGGKKGKGKGRESVHLEGSLGEWSVEKVLEDDGTVLPGATVAVHDAETGTFFLGGAVAPYISICSA